MRKAKLFNRSIGVIILLVSVACMVVMIMSMLNLPDIPLRQAEIHSKRSLKHDTLGKLGEMMVDMLPKDLAFTVFVPSERGFDRDLRLSVNQSFGPDKWDDTYATVSRVLGFSAVPRKIYSELVPVGKELSFDSISGFTLYISKDYDGVLVVNRVRSEGVVLKRGEVVVHIMDGVIMDSEFEQSVRPDDDQEE